MMNDLLSDGITRLRNGCLRRLEKVTLLNSKISREVLRVLKEEGYINGFKVIENGEIEVSLKYDNNGPVLSYIKRVSKCSKRIYSGIDKFPKTKSMFGLLILSTNKGIVSHVQARQYNVGGEILLEVN